MSSRGYSSADISSFVVFGQTAGTIEEWQVDHPTSDIADYYSGDSTLAQRHRISLIVFAVTTVATLFAGYIVWMRVRKIRPAVVQEVRFENFDLDSKECFTDYIVST